MNIERAVRQCLLTLNVKGMRKLWPQMHPHQPQPESDDELLQTMHYARMQMRTIDPALKAYSKAWLAERAKQTKDAWGVGISVNARSPDQWKRALMTRSALEYAVHQAVKEGVDLATEGAEITRRLALARARA